MVRETSRLARLLATHPTLAPFPRFSPFPTFSAFSPLGSFTRLASLGSLASLASVAALAVTTSGCTPSLIPNTDVEDTSQNKKVISYCEQYRHGVEEKNVGLLLKMASDRYYEDGGNTNAEDDIDLAGLKEYLTGSFVKTTAIRYEIRYRRVTFTQNEKVYVDYTYSASYKLPGLKGDEWRHTVADNRLVLVPDGDNYKILSGM